MGNSNGTVAAILYEDSLNDINNGKYYTFCHIESESFVISMETNTNITPNNLNKLKIIDVWKFNEHTIHPYEIKNNTIKNITDIKLSSHTIELLSQYLAVKDLRKVLEDNINDDLNEPINTSDNKIRYDVHKNSVDYKKTEDDEDDEGDEDDEDDEKSVIINEDSE
jgi:hypothetical protein